MRKFFSSSAGLLCAVQKMQESFVDMSDPADAMYSDLQGLQSLSTVSAARVT